MDLSDFERRFLDRFQKEVAAEFEIARNDYGILTLNKTAPCAEIGALYVFVKPEEITISCKITHTHSERGYLERMGSTDPEVDMITEAIGKVNDFISDRIVVSRTTAGNGMNIGSGWRTLEQTGAGADWITFLETLHPAPILVEEWTWSGPFKKN